MRVTKDKNNLVTILIVDNAEEYYKVSYNYETFRDRARVMGRIQLTVKEAKELIAKLNRVVGETR